VVFPDKSIEVVLSELVFHLKSFIPSYFLIELELVGIQVFFQLSVVFLQVHILKLFADQVPFLLLNRLLVILSQLAQFLKVLLDDLLFLSG